MQHNSYENNAMNNETENYVCVRVRQSETEKEEREK